MLSETVQFPIAVHPVGAVGNSPEHVRPQVVMNARKHHQSHLLYFSDSRHFHQWIAGICGHILPSTGWV